MESNEIQARFQRALDTLVAKLVEDPYVLAIVLIGSMSHDVVWEKSDIDLCIVTQEVKFRYPALNLTEEDVNIHAFMATRSDFKKQLEGSLRGSFVHSMLSKGTLLFTRDETICEAFEARHEFGTLDQQNRALNYVSGAVPALYKAEKWLLVRRDVDYTSLYILFCAMQLAGLEVVTHGEIPGREVLQQALFLNPGLFKTIYQDVIAGRNSYESLTAAIECIKQYLRDNIETACRPLLSWLAETGTIRSATEINDYFSKQMQVNSIDGVCEWLADENVIRKVSSPVRITEKSRVNVEEAAYYYDPDRD